MKLSDGEKLILLMLSDIQQAQGIKNSVDPEFIRSSIYYDCTWGLPWEYPGIPFEDTATPDTVRKVADIMQMWTIIETSFGHLSDADRQEVENKAQPFGSDPKFMGFDRTSETEEFEIALFLVNHLKRFLNFKGRNLNSQIPLSGRYRRMYEIYEPMINDLSENRLDVDKLVKILLQGS